MPHFPKPVKLPKSVFDARLERKKQIVSTSICGIMIRFCIIVFELIGVFLFGSSSLFMDAVSSFVDVCFSTLLIYCIKLAAKPPDTNHPFGHGRFEPLVGLQFGIFLACIGTGILYNQLTNLSSHSEAGIISPYVWIFPFCALILLELCYQIVKNTAKKQNSPALAVDAFHYRIDGLTSLFATIALIVAAYIPTWSVFIDHLGAIVIAIFMMILGILGCRNNFNQLLDKTPEKKYFDGVKKSAMSVNGVYGTEKIRIQLYGPNAHVDIDIEVDPKLPVDKAHTISQLVRAEIQKNWPAVEDVTVHIEPYYPNDHLL